MNYNEVSEYFKSKGCILLTTEYVNQKQELEYICPKNEIHKSSFKNFKRRNGRCPQKNKQKEKGDSKYGKRYNKEEIVEIYKKKGFIVDAENYKNNRTKMKCICNKGHNFYTNLNDFMNGHGCPECGNVKRLTYTEVKKFISFYREELISTEYINSHSLLEIKCKNNHIYTINYNNFYNGYRCPICNNNCIGENKIINFLNKLNISYEKQYTFDNCQHVNVLKFDFYIKNLNLVIEFDGEQHFRPIEFFGGNEKFYNTIIRDAIKNQYCEDNNINILRIPYWESKNIEKIIKEKINNLE